MSLRILGDGVPFIVEARWGNVWICRRLAGKSVRRVAVSGISNFDCSPDLAKPSTEEEMRSGRFADRGINN